MSFVEVLASALILAIGLGGVSTLLGFSVNMTRRSDEMTIGMNISRRTLEALKTQGFKYAPEGTTTREYDMHGNLIGGISLGPPPVYRGVTVVTSDRLAYNPYSGTYLPADDAVRSVVVTVTRVADGQVLYSDGTMLSRSGI